MEKEILYFKHSNGREPYWEWFSSLQDELIRHRIRARLLRIKHGNYGDHKRFYGIIEFRMDFGKGYRLYGAEDGERFVVLLLGGDKSSQEKDIKNALEYRRDYHEQNKI